MVRASLPGRPQELQGMGNWAKHPTAHLGLCPGRVGDRVPMMLTRLELRSRHAGHIFTPETSIPRGSGL